MHPSRGCVLPCVRFPEHLRYSYAGTRYINSEQHARAAHHLTGPVSTTHVIAGSIARVGSIQRLKAVRWGGEHRLGLRIGDSGGRDCRMALHDGDSWAAREIARPVA